MVRREEGGRKVEVTRKVRKVSRLSIKFFVLCIRPGALAWSDCVIDAGLDGLEVGSEGLYLLDRSDGWMGVEDEKIRVAFTTNLDQYRGRHSTRRCLRFCVCKQTFLSHSPITGRLGMHDMTLSTLTCITTGLTGLWRSDAAHAARFWLRYHTQLRHPTRDRITSPLQLTTQLT